MIKNFFLTGQPHIGKSTVIDAVVRELNLNACGFRTLRSEKASGCFSVHIVDAAATEKVLDDENCFALCDPQKYPEGFIVFPQVFDSLGVKMLEKAKEADLVIMDEIGFMEKDAVLFQKSVKDCLDSDIPVLGVIKKADSDFLNEIRKRCDVRVEDLDLFCRKTSEEITEKTAKLISKQIRLFRGI